MGGRITLRLCTAGGERWRALRPDEDMGGFVQDRKGGSKWRPGKGMAAGTWEERYFVAEFEQSAASLPLHPVLAASWFEAANAIL
jgi:hypothetical protein